VRSARSLAGTADALRDQALAATATEPGPQSWETTNQLHNGQLLTLAA
jgi:L-aspartate oxidase